MRRLLRLIDLRRMLAISRPCVAPTLPGHPRRPGPRPLLRTMLRAPHRRTIVMIRPMRIMRIRGTLAMRMRTMLVPPHRHHRMDRRMPATMGHLGAQMLASAEHFGTAVAARIEMPMTLAIRAHHPQIRAPADKHHVAIHDARNIDIARRRHINRRRRCAHHNSGRWRWRLHGNDSGLRPRPRGRGGNLLLAGDTAG
ncbi:hypothetical protein PPGU19_052130 [Paraburkholderia sp. PGU19]|nr:hypothetical protein PPGU19_052130 [Paraburkholderia sp. PGU19]